MEVWAGGYDLDGIAPVGGLQWRTRWGDGACGMYEATWTMSMPADYSHPALLRGQPVQIKDGPWRAGSSLIMNEPTRGSDLSQPWQFVATGVGREAERSNGYYCFDGSGNATSNPRVAGVQAIAAGLPWAGIDASIPNSNFSGVTDALNTLGQLYTSVADEAGMRWGVGQDDVARLLPEPTVPFYDLAPGVAALGVADDDYASTVKLRYRATASTSATATSPLTMTPVERRYGHREFLVDGTGYGVISPMRAQLLADGIYAKTKGRLGWVGSITCTSDDLTTPDGGYVDLATVEAGRILRLHGQFDDLLEATGRMHLEIVIAETQYVAGARSIDLQPVGMVRRGLGQVLKGTVAVAAT